MIKRIALLVMILMLGLSASALAAEPGGGTVSGQLVNGTKGGGSVANIDVTLKTYVNNAESSSTSAKTDAQGRFTFSGLSTDAKYSYQIITTYQEAEYDGEEFSFESGQSIKSIEFTVYDATQSNAALNVAMTHTVIYVRQGGLEVVEYYQFNNEADRSYIGSGEITATGKRAALDFSLPAKASEVQYGGELMECCILGTGGGFIDTMPVFPGNKEIAYSYKVTGVSGEYTYSRKMAYPTDRYELLVQDTGVKVSSDQLVAEDPVDIQSDRFQHYSGGSFAPGKVVAVQLSGLPKSGSNTIIWVALTLAALGGSSLYFLRRRRPQPVRAEGGDINRKRRLLVELARLDDDFENGKITEEEYRRLRGQRKAELLGLMQRVNEKSNRR